MDNVVVTRDSVVNSVRWKVMALIYMYKISLQLKLPSSLYTDECASDMDCSDHGSCIDLMSTSLPNKVCFCDPGWQGDNCARSG